MRSTSPEDSMAWERLRSVDVSKSKNIGSNRHVLKRVYGHNWNEWPRLVIGIFEKENSINVGITCKNKADGCWENVSIPRELVGDLSEMLAEYAKIKTTKKKASFLSPGAC